MNIYYKYELDCVIKKFDNFPKHRVRVRQLFIGQTRFFHQFKTHFIVYIKRADSKYVLNFLLSHVLHLLIKESEKFWEKTPKI